MNICSLLLILMITIFLSTSFWFVSSEDLFFITRALASSFLISTRTVPKIGWVMLGPGLEGSFLMHLITSRLTSKPGAVMAEKTCLILSRSVRPGWGSGSLLTANPSLSEMSSLPPILASIESIREVLLLTSTRNSSFSDCFEWMFNMRANMSMRMGGWLLVDLMVL